MDNLIDFFCEIGKLKGMPRRGWVINDIKNPESIAEHTFRVAIISWFLGEHKGLNIEKIIKMALIHDLCEVYAGDITPYDSVLPKNKKKRAEIMKTWPRISISKRHKGICAKYKKELESLEKITANLPQNLKKEIKNLWFDYEKGLTPEGRFFRQADRMESLLQSIEYWQKYKKPPQKPWWIWAGEFFDDPLLLEFMGCISSFHERKKQKENCGVTIKK